ncbi:hypothetical protein KTO58_03215 [Chitinophaga pendula]|uniref:hypothetical protein n=1 Tax=Chitinophaga pendula TaxID=2849666 RepID=UPI001CECAD87|nr:hypothetical protein [Chitinophaga pendula]UCJ08209.1 hypothetical protein KTO58_03215 [Chitinophaga pendula]
MKLLHSKIWKTICTIAVISSMAVISLAFKKSKDNRTLNIYSGQELFAGIILLKGEVAAAIPAYNELLPLIKNMEGTTAYQQFRDKQTWLLEKIQKEDPTYFEHFKREIASGDPVTINNAILEGQKKLAGLMMAERKSLSTSAKGIVDDILVCVVLPSPPVTGGSTFVVVEAYTYAANAKDNLRREELVHQLVGMFS